MLSLFYKHTAKNICWVWKTRSRDCWDHTGAKWHCWDLNSSLASPQSHSDSPWGAPTLGMNWDPCAGQAGWHPECLYLTALLYCVSSSWRLQNGSTWLIHLVPTGVLGNRAGLGGIALCYKWVMWGSGIRLEPLLCPHKDRGCHCSQCPWHSGGATEWFKYLQPGAPPTLGFLHAILTILEVCLLKNQNWEPK